MYHRLDFGEMKDAVGEVDGHFVDYKRAMR